MKNHQESTSETNANVHRDLHENVRENVDEHVNKNAVAKARKQEIKEALLSHLADKLVQFWDHVQSSEFWENRGVVVNFSGSTEIQNENILSEARQDLDLVLPLLSEYCLENTYLDRFAEEYLKKATDYVEESYAEAGDFRYEGDSIQL
jgi:hypothetical protein